MNVYPEQSELGLHVYCTQKVTHSGIVGWFVVLGFNATLTAKVISRPSFNCVRMKSEQGV